MSASEQSSADQTPPTYQIALRIIWMIIQIVAVMCIGGSGVHFLYQGF